MRSVLFYSILFIFIVSSCSITKKTSIINNEYIGDSVTISKIQRNLIEYKRCELYEDHDKSFIYLNQAYLLDSVNPVVNYELARFYFKRKKIDSAIVHINTSVNQSPNNLIYKKLRIFLYINNHDTLTTNKLYKELLSQYSDRKDIWFEVLDYYSNTMQYKLLLSYFDKFETKYGFNEQVLVNKYKIMLQLKQFKSLNKYLQNCVGKYPHNEVLLGILGDFYFNMAKYDDGLNIYNRILSINPHNTTALLALADFYRANKDFNKSFTYISQVIDNNDLDVNEKLQLTLQFLNLAKNNSKLFYFYNTLISSLRSQYPDNNDIILYYSNILLQKQEFPEAQKNIELALDSKPDNIDAWIKLLLIDSKLNQNRAIIEHATKAIEYFPNQTDLYYYRGFSYYILKIYDSATYDLKFADRISGINSPLKFDILSLLGECYYKDGDTIRAFNTFDKALVIKPNNYPLLNNYAYYLSLLKLNLEKAADMSKKTVIAEPKNSTYLDTYAWILFEQKKYKEAIKYSEKSVLYGGSKSGVILEHYGDILFKLSKNKEALEAWNEAVLLNDYSDKLKEKIAKKNYVE